MPKPIARARRTSAPRKPIAGTGPASAGSATNYVAAAATVGVIAAGVALVEVALLPGLLIGGAAVLAPRYLPRLRSLSKAGRHLQPLIAAAVRRSKKSTAMAPARLSVKARPAASSGFSIKQAVAKTITFRIIVTTLDFTSNYVVIGEATTSAGLSAFALVVGPLLYFAHEAGWNKFGPPVDREIAVGGVTISRPLAKTITFRTIATVMDFTTLYVVVGDLGTAAVLSAFGFVVGPFVYLGHEKAWDYYGAPAARSDHAPSPMLLLPAPG